ncbi:MAG: trypsin-like peptidase domain-containing protein [Pirellulaceae bacterium]
MNALRLPIHLLLLATCTLAAPLAAQTSTEIVKGQRLTPKAFRAAAAEVLPSVVRIESFGGIPGGAGRVAGEGPTTGLIISNDGYVVTSTFNFIKNPPIITVVTGDERRHVAKLVGRDDTRKICLLKIDVKDELPVPRHAPVDELRVGQWAVSVGVGFGKAEPALSAGIVSAKNRMGGRAIQTDANTSPANYGGPLVDIDGRVIGVCVPLAPGGGGDVGSGVEWYDSGIGFAIPLDGADKILEAMKAGKNIAPAFLGVAMKAAEDGVSGVTVSKLQGGGAAEKAGVKENDRVLKIDGEEIRDGAHLRALVGRRIAGDVITLTVRRGEQELDIEVALGERPQG